MKLLTLPLVASCQVLDKAARVADAVGSAKGQKWDEGIRDASVTHTTYVDPEAAVS